MHKNNNYYLFITFFTHSDSRSMLITHWLSALDALGKVYV